MTLNDADLDDAYDRFATALDPAVAIVTVTDGTEHSGCLVGFHGQVSIEPRRHGVWISQENHTYGLAKRAVAAAVHLLGPRDLDLAQLFGHHSGDDVDKFADIGFSDGPLGVRVLARLPDRIAGPCARAIETGGDHALLVIEPTDVHMPDPPGDGSPVIRLHDVSGIEPGHPEP